MALGFGLDMGRGAHAGAAIRNTLILHSCHTGETDSHVAALLGMTFFMEIILPCVGAGQSAAPTHTL